MIRTKGFTLIELLTVIGIIAILAAIIFPVMARVKDSAYRSSDSSNMNSLRTALSLYKVDQGGYPPAILGYASLYVSGAQMGQVVPAEQAIDYLYPKRVASFDVFQPSQNKVKDDIYTTAVWPNQDSRPPQTSPVFDLNGDGAIDNNPAPTGCSGPACFYDDDSRARQAFGTSTQVKRHLSNLDYQTGLNMNRNQAVGGETIDPVAGADIPSYFYNADGYDVAKVQNADGTFREETHYALFWSSWSLGSGDSHDDPRQLGYSDPPDDTVITWNSYFRSYDNATGLPTHDKRDIVLFLGGGSRPADSYDVNDRSWRITP